jgi:hypothetical protein
MYQLIYFYIVKLVEKRNPDSKFYSAGFLFFTQLVHVSFLLSIIKKLFNIQYPVFSDTYLINKLLWMPIVLIWLIIVHVYYKKRYTKLEKFYSGQKIVTLKNTVIVFSLLIIPLFFTILLLKK